MGEIIVEFHTAKPWVPPNVTGFFSLLPSMAKFCQADISESKSHLAIYMQGGVEGRAIGISLVVQFPSAIEAKSYKGMSFWREVPVYEAYQCKKKEGSKNNSGAESGKILSYRPESAAAPKSSHHGKLTSFIRLESNKKIFPPRIIDM